MEDNQVKVEKDGIVHVLHVDEDGEPISSEKIFNKPEKKKFKWGKMIVIYIIVFIVSTLLLAITATLLHTEVKGVGYLNAAIESYLIYLITEKKDWKLWKRILLIPATYIGVELAMWLVVKIFLFLLGLVIIMFHL